MACVVTSASNSSPVCVPPLSIAGGGRKRRPFDSTFDFDQVTKRMCRCSDAVRHLEASEEFMRKQSSASFSIARAIMNRRGPGGQESLSDEEEEDDDDDEGAEEREVRRNAFEPVTLSQAKRCSLSGYNRHSQGHYRNGPAPHRAGAIQRPQLLKGMIGRLQLEIYHLDRVNAKRMSEGRERQEEGGRVVTSQDRPKRLYTFRQLCRICQRLLRDQESRLHQFYEQTLTQRLSEQYDCFLRFTQEQLNGRLQHSQVPSYIS